MGYWGANYSILECILGCPLWGNHQSRRHISTNTIVRLLDVLSENVMLKGYKEFRMRCFATSCDKATLNDNRC